MIVDAGQLADVSVFGDYSSYMNMHATEVPVGDKYQASIPKLQSRTHYINNRLINIHRIHLLKIHDAESSPQFLLRHK